MTVLFICFSNFIPPKKAVTPKRGILNFLQKQRGRRSKKISHFRERKDNIPQPFREKKINKKALNIKCFSCPRTAPKNNDFIEHFRIHCRALKAILIA